MSKKNILIFSLSTVFFLSAAFITFSWVEITTNMPSSYTTPIDTSGTAQSKSGTLSAKDFYDNDNSSYYINPSGNSVISGKITTGTSTTTTDDGKTLVTKDYADNINCRLVYFGAAATTNCPTGYYVTEMVASAQTGYMLCCQVSNPL